MNPIATWCKFKDYGEWCYKYRIPSIEEFVEGFEYEFLTFMLTKPGRTRIDDSIEVHFSRCLFGREYGNKSLSEIKSYLEAGHIRVPKESTEIWMIVNKENGSMQKDISYPHIAKTAYWHYLQDKKKGYDVDYTSEITEKQMKLYIFGIHKRDLTEDADGNILKLGSISNESTYRYIIGKGINAYEASKSIKESYLLRKDPMGKTQGILDLSTTEKGYSISTGGKEFIQSEYILDNEGYISTLGCRQKSIFIMNDSMSLVFKNTIIDTKNKAGKMKASKNKVKNFLSNIQDRVKKLVIKYNTTTRVELESKYPTRFQDDTWKPVEHKKISESVKSPDRLVYISTKTRNETKRLKWIEAKELVQSGEYEFISKEDGRKLTKVRVGKAFTTPISGPSSKVIKKAKIAPKSVFTKQSPKPVLSYNTELTISLDGGSVDITRVIKAKSNSSAIIKAKNIEKRQGKGVIITSASAEPIIA